MTEYEPHLLGKSGEEVALRYLKRKKYKIVEKGFRLFRGEIDIIAYDKKTLVFIEVKTRTRSDFGLPEEAVTPAKQRQIRKIAQGYLNFHKIRDVECRFDVIALVKTDNESYSLRHIKNAF
jgi:putative endonuclease